MLGNQATPQMQELEGIQHDPMQDWTPNEAQERLLNQVNPWREIQQRGGWRKVLGGLAEGYFSPQAGEQAKDLAVRMYQQDREMEMKKQEMTDMKKFRGVQMEQMQSNMQSAEQERHITGIRIKALDTVYKQATQDAEGFNTLLRIAGLRPESPQALTAADLTVAGFKEAKGIIPALTLGEYMRWLNGFTSDMIEETLELRDAGPDPDAGLAFHRKLLAKTLRALGVSEERIRTLVDPNSISPPSPGAVRVPLPADYMGGE